MSIANLITRSAVHAQALWPTKNCRMDGMPCFTSTSTPRVDRRG